MKDFIELIKNLPNILGIIYAGILISLLFPQTMEPFYFYVHCFLIIILFIFIIRYVSSIYDLISIFSGSSLIELLIVENCRIRKIQTYKINEKDKLFESILSLTLKGIFFKPDKSDLFVMYNHIYEFLKSRFVRKRLHKMIEVKKDQKTDSVLKSLSRYLLDIPLDVIIKKK